MAFDVSKIEVKNGDECIWSFASFRVLTSKKKLFLGSISRYKAYSPYVHAFSFFRDTSRDYLESCFDFHAREFFPTCTEFCCAYETQRNLCCAQVLSVSY